MPDRIVDGAVPKHEQLRAILLRHIADLPVGSPVPSERQLVHDHGVSRITVREAIGQLVAEGRLDRVRGKGTFVAHGAVRSTLHLASFTQEMTRLGHVPSTVVLVRDESVPPAETAVALQLPPGETAVHVRRLRLADGAPMSIDDGWYPSRVVPGLLTHDLSASLYRLLDEEYGHPVTSAAQTVSAEGSDDDVATLLGTRTGAPVLFFDRVSRSGEVPVEHARSWYRADRYRVQMNVTSAAPGPAWHPVAVDDADGPGGAAQ